MKRFFIGVIALVASAFAFLSCEGEGFSSTSGGDKGKTDEKYLTVQDQQDIISNSMTEVAESFNFTNLSNVIQTIAGITDRNIGMQQFEEMIESNPDLATDRDVLQRMAMIDALFGGKADTLAFDLRALYMYAKIRVVDSIADNKIVSSKLELERYELNYEGFQLSFLVGDDEISFAAWANAGESIIRVTNDKKSNDKIVFLPSTTRLVVQVNNAVLFDLNSDYSSDINIFVNKDSLILEGNKLSIKNDFNIIGYRLVNNFDLDMSKSINTSLKVVNSKGNVFLINGWLKGSFEEGLNLMDSIQMMAWMMNPEKFESVRVNASVLNNAIQLKGTLQNPFKDTELAGGLVELKAGATWKKDKAEKMIAKLNDLLKVELYFEGYDNPQATLKLVYDPDKQKPFKGFELTGVEKADAYINAFAGLIAKSGAYPVWVVRGDDGKETTIPVDDYFDNTNIKDVKAGLKYNISTSFAPIKERFSKENLMRMFK